jgi:hypothetical protein
MVEVADIFRCHGPAYRAQFADRLLPSPLAAMTAIAQCRTEALGGHLSQGADCGELAYRYHSCKNRHCPKCQNAATTRWLDQQRTLLLPVPYFLVTFTLPEALRLVTRAHQHCLYNILFQTSAAALHALALAPHYLGGHLGMVGVLHTWTRDLASHPHVHSLVPGGALSPDETTWLSPRSAAWLVPVRALSRLFRGKFHAALTPTGLAQHVPPQGGHTDWGTHCQPAGSGREVLTSFAPSIYRIALTNNRLEALEDGQVTFRYKKRTGTGWQRLTLPAEAFIYRFLQHVLPKGVPTVRAYGLLSPSRRQGLPQIRALLAANLSTASAAASSAPRAPAPPPPTPAADRRCRHCGGRRGFLGRLARPPREPP